MNIRKFCITSQKSEEERALRRGGDTGPIRRLDFWTDFWEPEQEMGNWLLSPTKNVLVLGFLLL